MSSQIESGVKQIICSTCHIKFNDIQTYKLHLATEYHVYNTKRRMAELAPITEEIFEQKRSLMVNANASALTDVFYKCQPCNKNFKTNEMLDEHKKSKKHKREEKEWLIKNPGQDSSIFKSIATGSNILSELDQSEKIKAPQIETSLDSIRICLFCNKKHDGLKKNLDHMLKKHSFILLDVDCLTDLKGMLRYMAERIHLGQLCLYCSRQFRDGRRAQQHMCDSHHCMMNMEDEDEYTDFYDFSKTYKDHPLLIKPEEEINDKLAIKEAPADDEWEDVDLEDAGSGDDDEEEANSKADDSVEEEKSESFTIVDKDKSESFSLVDKEKSESLAHIDSMKEISGIKSLDTTKQQFILKEGTGKTREEVFLGLHIKKAKLLPSGEVKLGNGKIIGTRKWNYLYKQKPRLPDQRESVLVAKIALEYRKIRAIQNGGKGDALDFDWDRKQFKEEARAKKVINKAMLKHGMQMNNLQYHFKDPTGFLQ